MMHTVIRKYEESDIGEMIDIWNGIVEDGNAFPQKETLDSDSGKNFFASQTYTGVAYDTEKDKICGLYILHPNNVGRCGHICNASYAVDKNYRGCGIGRLLVEDCLKSAKEHSFKILQFNAVVASNVVAQKLYEKMGFKKIGIIPNGFCMKDGNYEDIYPYYYEL